MTRQNRGALTLCLLLGEREVVVHRAAPGVEGRVLEVDLSDPHLEAVDLREEREHLVEHRREKRLGHGPVERQLAGLGVGHLGPVHAHQRRGPDDTTPRMMPTPCAGSKVGRRNVRVTHARNAGCDAPPQRRRRPADGSGRLVDQSRAASAWTWGYGSTVGWGEGGAKKERGVLCVMGGGP